MDLSEWTKYSKKYTYVHFKHEDENDQFLSAALGFYKHAPIKICFENDLISKVESYGVFDGTKKHHNLKYLINFQNGEPVHVENYCPPFGVKYGNQVDAKELVEILLSNFGPFFYDLVETNLGVRKRGEYNE